MLTLCLSHYLSPSSQGLIWNVFFFSYLINPKICHRFVGYVEVRAVESYMLVWPTWR